MRADTLLLLILIIWAIAFFWVASIDIQAAIFIGIAGIAALISFVIGLGFSSRRGS